MTMDNDIILFFLFQKILILSFRCKKKKFIKVNKNIYFSDCMFSINTCSITYIIILLIGIKSIP